MSSSASAGSIPDAAGSASDSIFEDPSKQTSLERMKALFPDVGPVDLQRFLKARKNDEAKATDMITKHLTWRADTLPIEKAEIQESLDTRRYYYLCQDAEDRPVVYIHFQRFMREKYDADIEIKAYIWLIENEIIPQMSEAGPQSWTVLIDVQGIRSPPISFLTKLNSVFEANYPERLHKTIMFPVPWFVQKMINGFLFFVNEDTRKKFGFVNALGALISESGITAEQLGADVEALVKEGQLTSAGTEPEEEQGVAGDGKGGAVGEEQAQNTSQGKEARGSNNNKKKKEKKKKEKKEKKPR
jgi:hypothetical protein